ncbi:MAG: hypothetical protein IPL58_14130 [Betaproteobacteria bacterium]|uniref:Uncharacterized protein n=1 Tax=Candidatus Proximibacter danicus TaxID=2954365 RepID=A0A9D7PTT2_9PROT|nr:hypothetical protein [Candidatus Proximibacter danicus]
MKVPASVPAFVLALLLSSAASAAPAAAMVSCPDLAKVVQAGTCPTEEELLFTFNGYCSDNARIYGKGAEVCTNYASYRKLKNIVLWEKPGTDFQAYVSCDLPGESFKGRKPSAITVSKQGKMTRLACSYGEGVTFTYRTHRECRVENAEACKTHPAACKASCE